MKTSLPTDGPKQDLPTPYTAPTRSTKGPLFSAGTLRLAQASLPTVDSPKQLPSPAQGPQEQVVKAASESVTPTAVPLESQHYHHQQQMGYPTMEEMAMHFNMQAAAMEQAYQWHLALAHQVGSTLYPPMIVHLILHHFQRIYQLEAMLQVGHSFCAMCGGDGGCGMGGGQ